MRALREQFAHAAGAVDPVVVALLIATAAADVAASGGTWRDAVIAALIPLPLLARRRAPLLVLAVVIAVTYAGYASAPGVAGGVQAGIAFNIALSTVAAHCERGRALAGVAIAGAFGLAYTIPVLVEGGRATDVGAAWLFLAGVWVLGRWVRARRRRTDELEHETERLGAERDARARAAVADERARIAREMHDSVAHSVSLMVLQAGAAEQVLDIAPERARASLATIQDTGRDAIVELRRMLGLLRETADQPSLAPQPTVARLDALVEQIRGAGLAVDLTVEGEPRRLPPGVDRSAYRIVQEALTNTLKHAGPAHATVTLRYHPLDLELEVLDDGQGAESLGGGGFGHVGMRERAALYGGVLDAGPRPGGGYALRARLPLERTRP